MSNIMPFNYEGNQVRTIVIDSEPWFVAKDVCDVLELEDTGRAIERLDLDESTRIEIDHPQSKGKLIEVYAVNEPGLYSLVLGSRKPEAKSFKRWITHEVIPQIRKTGSYQLQPMTTSEFLLQTAQAMVEHERKLTALENAHAETVQFIQNVKEVMLPTDKEWRKYINDQLNKIARACGGDYSGIRETSYSLLEKKAACKLSIRVKNMKERLADQGATKTKVANVCRLDVIEAEPRLKEIYTAIVKELAIKHVA